MLAMHLTICQNQPNGTPAHRHRGPHPPPVVLDSGNDRAPDSRPGPWSRWPTPEVQTRRCRLGDSRAGSAKGQGINTPSMTWMTPLSVVMSVDVTFTVLP